MLKHITKPLQTRNPRTVGDSEELVLPSDNILDMYWNTFLAIPNCNLPIIHPASTNCENAPGMYFHVNIYFTENDL